MAKTKINPLEFFRKASEERMKKMRPGGQKAMIPKYQIKGEKTGVKQYIDSISAKQVKPIRPRFSIPGTNKPYNSAKRDSVIKSWFNKMQK